MSRGSVLECVAIFDYPEEIDSLDSDENPQEFIFYYEFCEN